MGANWYEAFTIIGITVPIACDENEIKNIKKLFKLFDRIYVKNNELFYKLDPASKIFTEVYRSPLQKRIQVNFIEAVYDATILRIADAGFIESTEEVFESVYNLTKSEL
jgi:hypothetical protein